MQSDINKIVEWCETWPIVLSPEKCKCMHLWKQSNLEDYFKAGKKLSVTESERDFGVFVSKDGIWHEQLNSVESKTNRVLGLARIIYSTFIRLYLEFASSTWNTVA